MTTQEVKQLCEKHNKTWEEFQEFMHGQTYGMDCVDCSNTPDEVVPNAKYTCPKCGGLDWQANWYEVDVARFLQVNRDEL